MKPKSLLVCALIFGYFVASAAVSAHHGNAAFDNEKKLTMKGTVTQWLWANPHCFLQYDVADANGQTVHWVVETSNPPDMVNRGWSKGSFKPGDQVTVTLTPVKDSRPIGRMIEVVLPSGQTLSATSGPTPAPKAGGVAPGDKPGAYPKQ